MKIFLAALLFTTASALTVPILQDVDTEWSLFKTTYGKVYESLIEENLRKAIFTDNYNLIKERNLQYESGLITYILKINKFADATSDEMTLLQGFNSTKTQFNFETYQSSSVAAPDSFDWTQKGAVTRVKDQGSCGSSWAFSTTGSLEGQYFLKTGQLVEISEQNLVDCSTVNAGCDGGDMVPAFDYILNNGGIDSEASYPYTGVDGTCYYNTSNSVITVTGYVKLDVDQLKDAVANIGPISVAIDASSQEFVFYSDGIFDPEFCIAEGLSHGVLVVGFGSANGQDYWLVKNSWSLDWGSSGYIKMIRSDDNQCIGSDSIYPTL